ncbi:hypothetical protein HZS_4391, partial [Henneguya salminicola]
TQIGQKTRKISKEAAENLNAIMSIAKSPEFVIPEEDFIAIDQDLFSKYEYSIAENHSSQNYQLQITIHEGKGFKGNRISPFCRMSFNKEIKLTDVKKQTNSPYWDSLFVFDMMGEYTTMAKYILKIQVISDNGTFRRNTIIGCFRIDFQTIFNNKDHNLLKKWIRLYSPNDRAQKNEPQLCGFLKVSLVIIVPTNINYIFCRGLLLPDGYPTSRNKVAIKVTIHFAQDLNKGKN